MPGFLRPRGLFLVAAVCVTAWSATASSVETARAERPTAGAGPSVVAYGLDVSSPLPPAVHASGPSALLADDTLPPVTTASGADDLWHNAPVTVTFTATDAGGEVAYTEYKLDGADWERGTQMTVPAPPDHSGDGLHTLLFRSADEAGNLEDPPGSVTVKIDTTPPTTTAAGAHEADWYRAPLTLSFDAAADAGSGVAYTEYSVDGADWLQQNELSVPAPPDHAADGPRTVLYRSADNAGNVEEAHSLSFGIDTVRPTTRAPNAATVMRYRTARLAYKVLDANPNGGSTGVTIKIRDKVGALVKTLTYDARPVNTPLAASFACMLARGNYRFFVYATDAAGNRQGAVGSNRLTVTAPWSSSLPFSFRISGLRLRDVGLWDYPPLNMADPVPREDTGVHDELGVRMEWRDGKLYNHVSLQATYGLENLASYHLTGDPFYLARAEAQAQRLMERRILVGTAWFHPNDFPYPGMKPPWCSALGQGRCLRLFTALFRATGNPVYEEAAQGTFEGYLRRGPLPSPWVVNVDADGYLWLEEYPSNPPNPVLNGHITSTYGLFDYYQLTHDERALELFNGALTTLLHYASWFRQPGWTSYYNFSHGTSMAQYHEAHIGQFLTLYKLTGATSFARIADTFTRDYPKPGVSGRITVVPGIYVGLRFDSLGRAIGRRAWRITEVASIPVIRRQRIRNQQGYWFATTLGPWTGYYLHEQAGAVYLAGALTLLSYDPPRTVLLPGDHTYVGRTYDADGALTDSVTFAAETATTATVDRRGIVNGTDQAHVTSGPLQGHWLRLGTAVLQ